MPGAACFAKDGRRSRKDACRRDRSESLAHGMRKVRDWRLETDCSTQGCGRLWRSSDNAYLSPTFIMPPGFQMFVCDARPLAQKA